MKKTLLCLELIFCTLILPALPGVKDFLPTESGQYVYYRDSTFTSPVYIGFLQYDESTYAVRYCSPQAAKGSKEINVFISLDPQKDHVSMTGEKILETLLPEDTETLNYLHDLFYEFGARRKKLRETFFTDSAWQMKQFEQTEDFSLFGGEYTFVYDYIIPLFNVREIKSKSGEKTFTAVTMGQLSSSSDTAFTSFTGLPENEKNIKAVAADVHDTTGAQKTAGCADKNLAVQVEKMDALLRQIADNFWFWESQALMYTDIVQYNENIFDGKIYSPFHFFARMFSCAGTETVLCLEKQRLFFTGNRLLSTNCVYDRVSQRFVHHIEIVTKKEQHSFEITGFKIFSDYYDTNKAYFDRKIREAYTP